MNRFTLAGVAVLAIAGSTAVYAQHRPWFHHRPFNMSAEDRSAFADARIAAVHAGLKLTPDQEKMWPPVETAVKDFAKLRIDRANARLAPPQADAGRPSSPADPIARLQERADTMAATAAALKRIADAADPLYKTLDDGQKCRLTVLTRMGGRFGGGEGWRPGGQGPGFGRGMDRDSDAGRDRDGPRGGPDRGFGRPGPDRL